MSFIYVYGIHIAIALCLTTSLVALALAIWMHRRVSKIFASAKMPDVESLLQRHGATVHDLLKFRDEAIDYMKDLDRRIQQKLMSAKTLRYNPFQGEGVGGNQSFVSVFADEKGDGVVITSMHTRERTNVFAKPLTSWKSEYELGEEEEQTIEKALRSVRKPQSSHEGFEGQEAQDRQKINE